ncbi:MAG: ASCH domain-containing protein [Crocosphaera sp.]|uniref:ASCH domain-containing protein n=1 Tax=Crocosphaera sp. TaxID=2729996 RepID=UPI00258857F3|nr:ASCH domain-containing protein [Crocosphaera sp.]MCH2245763.1 ASCH domain-containing protein [Crocosphaera sp.]
MNEKNHQISGLSQESREPITKIKAISLHQPYASLIAMGLKQFETRSWSTNYRGKLVICAALKNSKQQQLNYETLANSFDLDLTVQPWSSLPLGMAIAVVDLTDCIEMTDEFIDEQSEAELLCGHWESGRFAWKLENVQPFPQPFPIKGKQGLWNITDEEFEQLCADGFWLSRGELLYSAPLI